MQTSTEYVCTDCGGTFERASELLKHFAEHARVDDANILLAECSKLINKKTTIPDLYPISVFKELHNTAHVEVKSEPEELNPSNYCEITLGKTESLQMTNVDEKSANSSYDYGFVEPNLSKKFSTRTNVKRKQLKCSIKRKCTKFHVQNSLLCST